VSSRLRVDIAYLPHTAARPGRDAHATGAGGATRAEFEAIASHEALNVGRRSHRPQSDAGATAAAATATAAAARSAGAAAGAGGSAGQRGRAARGEGERPARSPGGSWTAIAARTARTAAATGLGAKGHTRKARKRDRPQHQEAHGGTTASTASTAQATTAASAASAASAPEAICESTDFGAIVDLHTASGAPAAASAPRSTFFAGGARTRAEGVSAKATGTAAAARSATPDGATLPVLARRRPCIIAGDREVREPAAHIATASRAAENRALGDISGRPAGRHAASTCAARGSSAQAHAGSWTERRAAVSAARHLPATLGHATLATAYAVLVQLGAAEVIDVFDGYPRNFAARGRA
jgi:hypothetical protein